MQVVVFFGLNNIFESRVGPFHTGRESTKNKGRNFLLCYSGALSSVQFFFQYYDVSDVANMFIGTALQTIFCGQSVRYLFVSFGKHLALRLVKADLSMSFESCADMSEIEYLR